MKIQTKCTLSLFGLFILEILPIPFTASYSLYAVWRRPDWLPEVVEQLYAEKEQSIDIETPSTEGYNPKATRLRCTLSLAFMFILDIVIPCTILTGLYIVRRRPAWFKNTVSQLYIDKTSHDAVVKKNAPTVDNTILEKKYFELQKKNTEFALSLGTKTKW